MAVTFKLNKNAMILQFLKYHRWTIVVFFTILFRPQILSAIRHECVLPFMIQSQHCQRLQPPVRLAVMTTDSDDDDGCGDDGSCEEEDNEYYDTDASDSDDSGCNDDGSCENDSYDATYDDDETYSDDGCDCSGGGTVSSDVPPSGYYNDILHLSLTLNNNAKVSLYIVDNSGTVLKYIIPSHSDFNAGLYTYSWDGEYRNGQFVVPGSYQAVFEADVPRKIVKRSFTYSASHGFSVNGSSQNTIDF
ncbi:hypothetical protein K1X84_13085 [bacterium]|nr:hypothetical protein [bacterium]